MRVCFYLTLMTLLGSGCSSVPRIRSTFNRPQEQTQNVNDKNRHIRSALQEKRIPIDFYRLGTDRLSVVDYDRADCIGMENGLTNGGDLLTTLIQDEHARRALNLHILTPEYLSSLRGNIGANLTDGTEVYAFYICHLENSVDLVAGILWPKDMTTWSEHGDKIKIHQKFNHVFASTTLLLITNGRVHSYTQVPVMNATLTGGETSPCSARTVGNEIEWRCMRGWSPKHEPASGWLQYEYWSIPITGGKPTFRTVSEKSKKFR